MSNKKDQNTESQDENQINLEERLKVVEEKIPQLEEENEALRKALSEANNKKTLGVEVKDEEPYELPSQSISDEDGNEYKFVKRTFIVPGFGKMEADEAVKNEDVCAFLIGNGSTVIELVKKGKK